MIKHAPILIEFGDGDTGYRIGLTEEGEGCVALFNAEPGEIGREIVGEPPEGSIGAYIVFKNVKSLDCIIRNFQKLRDIMAAEGTDEKKTGYWSKNYDPLNNSSMLQCSVCKNIEVYNGDLVSFPDICSECGAKME